MSFKILPFTASTQAAINIFHIFQNGLVNLVVSEEGYTQCELAQESAFVPGCNLRELTGRLTWFYPDEVQLKIYDIVSVSGVKVRLVEFSLERNEGMEKTTFSVSVGQREARWVLREATLSHVMDPKHPRMERLVRKMVIKPVTGSDDVLPNLPLQVGQYIGGLVRVESSTF